MFKIFQNVFKPNLTNLNNFIPKSWKLNHQDFKKMVLPILTIPKLHQVTVKTPTCNPFCGKSLINGNSKILNWKHKTSIKMNL